MNKKVVYPSLVVGSAIVVAALVLIPLSMSLTLRVVIGVAGVLLCAGVTYAIWRTLKMSVLGVAGGVVGGLLAGALLAYVVIPFQGLPKDEELDGTRSSDGKALVAITIDPVVDPGGGVAATAKFADNVFIARVVRVVGVAERDGSASTTYEVEVSDTLKGAAPENKQVIRLGGETNKAIYNVPGDLAPIQGRTYAFLTKGATVQNVIPGFGVVDTTTESVMNELRAALGK